MKKITKEKINELIEKDYPNITGVIIQKNSDVLYENYFNESDSSSPINIASVTKSIMSLLIGIAIDKKFIDSEDKKVLDFFPEYKLKRGEKVLPELTIRNLLTMTTPFKFRSEPYTKVYSSSDWTKAVLDLMGGRTKEIDFKYTTVGLHVLSGILTKSTGKSVLKFAEENLFKLLNIEPPSEIVLNDREEHISFIKNCKTKSWVKDLKGVFTAGWGLSLTTRDLLKIGGLCINQGMYNGRQVVSDKWIEKSTVEHSKMGNLSYGYLWWIINDKEKSYAAIGDGGNIIYISESKNIVVAITSSFMVRAKDRVDLIESKLLNFIS